MLCDEECSRSRQLSFSFNSSSSSSSSSCDMLDFIWFDPIRADPTQ
jgi:hypothetical protein